MNKPDEKNELDQMAEDVKKAVGKEKEELVSKTIAETKERLAREKELADMKAKLDTIEKERLEEAERYKKDLQSVQSAFKDETDKIIREFQDARKSSVNTNNPFEREHSNSEPSFMERYKTDEVFSKQVDEESRYQFYEYLDKRHR